MSYPLCEDAGDIRQKIYDIRFTIYEVEVRSALVANCLFRFKRRRRNLVAQAGWLLFRLFPPFSAFFLNKKLCNEKTEVDALNFLSEEIIKREKIRI